MRSLVCTAAVLLVAGCPASLVVDGPSGLPLAQVTCPDQAVVGVPVTLDGSASRDTDGAALASMTWTVDPGGHSGSGPTLAFTPTLAGTTTARLVVVDQDGQGAEARCRFAVAGGPDVPVDPEDPDVPGGPIDLNGTFALVAYDRPEMQGGALDPARQCASAPQLSLVEMTHSGSALSFTARTCVITMPRVQVFAAGFQDPQVPAAFVDALPALGPVDVTLSESAAGATFTPSAVALRKKLTAGAVVDDAAPLPTDEFAPEVEDADGDDAPGVSIQVGAVRQSLVYRRWFEALAGTVVSSDLVDGSTPGSYQSQNESALLGLFSFLVPQGTGLPSTFKLVRVDGGARDLRGADGVLDNPVTCDDLRAQQAALLALLPPPAPPADCTSFE